jgi:hypothetical protein
MHVQTQLEKSGSPEKKADREAPKTAAASRNDWHSLFSTDTSRT